MAIFESSLLLEETRFWSIHQHINTWSTIFRPTPSVSNHYVVRYVLGSRSFSSSVLDMNAPHGTVRSTHAGTCCSGMLFSETRRGHTQRYCWLRKRTHWDISIGTSVSVCILSYLLPCFDWIVLVIRPTGCVRRYHSRCHLCESIFPGAPGFVTLW